LDVTLEANLLGGAKEEVWGWKSLSRVQEQNPGGGSRRHVLISSYYRGQYL